MRYQVKTTNPEALKTLPFVWEVEPAGDNTFAVHAEQDKAVELGDAPGVTAVEVLGYNTVLEIGISPEALARLRLLWQKCPEVLKQQLGIVHINFGD